MLQLWLLQFLQLSPNLQRRLRNFRNLPYMSIFTWTSTIMTVLPILPILDPLLLRSPPWVQLKVLLLVRRSHRTLGVIVLLLITVPIAHPTSLVLIHVLVQAQRWIAHSPRRFACTWWCPSPLRTIVAETLRVLGDEGKEVVLRLLVVVNIHVNVVIVLVRQFSVTPNLLMWSIFSMLSILMLSIIMSFVLAVVLLVASVLKTCLVLLAQFQLDRDVLHGQVT